MTTKKFCGFDVNGWRDFVAKNWRSLPGDDEEVGPVELVGSGPLSSTVCVGNGSSTRWIGGAQADIAPHGLGGGWGEIGAAERRVSVRSLLELHNENLEILAACFSGAAQGGSYNVLAIDEGPDGSETHQEHLLNALNFGKYKNPLLVWRPVLAALYAIEKGLVEEGQLVGVVCQDRLGVATQKLLIRSARGVLAAERREAANHTKSEFGYENLVFSARKAAVGNDGFKARTAHRAIAASVGRAALGMECRPEILRLKNGDWEVLDLSGYDASKTTICFEDEIDLNGCDVVLFETLTEGAVRGGIFSQIERMSPAPVFTLPAEAVARGALSAAERAGNGAPIFFDFLPRMSTIVFGTDGAKNFDLIRPEETLEAGRVYRSPKPASLAIPAGQKSVSVYLRKEAAPPPRKATVSIGKPLAEQAAVSLWVEQKPAAGRARILMEAPSLGRNFAIEWDAAEEVDRSWEEIIEDHATRVSIPHRLVLPCGMHAWEDSSRSDGLKNMLQQERFKRNPDWDTLASKLAQRPFGQYCISSDGNIPTEIGERDRELLDDLTEMAMQVTQSRLFGETGPGTEDNAALRFLTWQFRRCPQVVATWLIDCLDENTGLHPFVHHQSSWILVYQGLGRIIGDDETEARVIRKLLASDVETWVWNRQSACMAFLLSRSDTAPTLLSRVDVERMARRAILDFERNIGGEYTTFNYAPFLLAGLLRWRLKEPGALVAGIDPIAHEFQLAINAVEADLTRRNRYSPNLNKRREKILAIMRDLKQELEGSGTNPDLLLDIYSVN